MAPRPSEKRALGQVGRVVTAGAALLVAAGTAARYGPGVDGVISAFAAGVLVVLAAIDIDQRRVPNAIVLPAGLAVLAARMLTDLHHAWVWPAAAFGAALAFFILAAVHPGGLGMGDVKLVFLIGATLGSAVLVGLVLGTLTGAVAGIVILVRRGAAGRSRAIPYAPFLCFGALAVLLLLRP